MTGCLAHFPIGMGNYHNISNRKMTLASERGETSYNSLTIILYKVFIA